ncbi:SdrD B-like domain-containing protein, partial [Flavilitoribacter nigricans]
ADPAMNGMTETVTLESGDNYPDLDAGILEGASLGDFVWEDLDGDGVQDPGEPGVGGVTVNLKDENGNVIDNTTTAADGSYSFTNLEPGTYSVQFTDLPAGFSFTDLNAGGDEALDSDADPAMNGMTETVTLESGDNYPDLDAGILQGASLGDFVWEDLDGDGVQDPGEPGVGGVTVNLKDENGNVIDNTTTAADGSYSFTNLEPGTYSVQFTDLPAGFSFTDLNAGGDEALDSDADPAMNGMTETVTLESGDNYTDLDAGILEGASLGDFVWEDLDGDGVQDPGEPGVGGVTVNLKDENGNLIDNTTTAADGSYSFTNLEPGTYSVQFTDLPAGFSFTDLNAGGDEALDSDADPAMNGMTETVTLESGDNYTDLDAGILQGASLGDFVWEDLDGDGVQDPGEPGVAGVTVNLKDENGNVIDNTTTAADGSYSFTNLEPGTYSVQFTDLPAGFSFTDLNAGGDEALDSDADPAMNGMTETVTLESGDNYTDLDAGILEGASLGDFVWEDLDGDGVQDPGEPGVAGVTVNLKDENGNVIDNTTTAADGSYSFTNLEPGTYSVQFTDLPAGFSFTDLNAGGDEALDSDADPAMNGMTETVTLESGDNYTDLDAGILEGASLGDFVWEDLDGDGVQDPGEPGVGGVTVNLKDENGNVIDNTTTAADGSYSFTNLEPGTYSVQFTDLPAGFVLTDLGVGNEAEDSDADPAMKGMTETVTLESGDNYPDLDAGIIELQGSVVIEKSTNGLDADAAPGAIILVPDNAVPVNWEYVVTNNGELDLINVQVVDDQEGIICTIPRLNVGESTTCTASGIAQLGAYQNIATVTGQPVDGETPVGGPVSDEDPSNYTGVYINVQKDASAEMICADEPVTYTLTVRLLGGAPGFELRNIQIDDTNLPGTLTPASPEFVASSDLDSDGVLDFGEEFVFEYTQVLTETTTNIAMDLADLYVNDAFIATIGNEDEQTVSIVEVAHPDLLVSLDPTSQNVVEGEDGSITVTITNTGDVTLENIQVTDQSGNTTFSELIPSLAPGAFAEFTLTVMDVAENLTVDIFAEGTAVDSEGATLCTKTDEASGTITVDRLIDLELIKSVDNAIPNVGDNVTFTISVTNDGPSVATGVTVTDNLPSGYSFVSSDGDYVGGLWTIGTIGVGETVTLNITATVLESGDYFNVAEVTTANEDDVDSTPNNDDGDQSEDDEDNAVTNPNAVIDLSLTKVVDNATPNVGDDVIFTISVTNDGPSVATGVTVTDNLPSGYSFVSSDGDYVGGLWTIGTIGIGETVTLNITATVLASGDYFNVAEVTTANEDDTDSTPNNDDGDQSEDDEDNAETNPNPVIDLSLVKTVSDATPNVGDDVIFTISVTNDGPSVATGVTVTDNLPSGYSFVSSDGDYVGGLWTIGTIGIGETVTLNITATVLASGDYFNVAEVTTANEDDTDSTPNNDDGDQSEDDEDNAVTNPNAVIDLSLTKVVDNATPNVGDDVIFTISVTNDGPSVATGVTVTDNLPSGYSFVSSDGDYVGGLWTIGTIGIGETVTLNITATVLASGDYFNVAEVTSANEDDVDSTPNNDDGDQSEDDEDNAETNPNPVIDLSLVKTVSDATPNVGDDVIFTISVTNDGPSVATGVTVTDNLPSGYSFVSSDGDYVGGLWTIGTIGIGETVTLNITATVLASGDYFNVAEVTTANEDDTDSTPNNDDGDQSEDDEDNADTDPNPVIDLSLVKTVSDATPNVGDDVIFTISVTNDGPSVATGVTVTDNLPSGYSFVSSDGDYVGGLWTIGTIGIGETVTLNITATVLESGDYFNVAEVTTANEDDTDSTPNNDDGDQSEDDEDNADTNPNPVIDLSLIKTVSDATPNVGDDVIFTISVTNNGPSVATGVTVTDNLPSGYSFVSSDGDYVGGLWTIGTIGIGETVTLNITATVLASGDYFNVAEVTTANEDDTDSTPNNDDGDQSEDDEDNADTNPNPVIDLSLTKVVDNTTPNVGDDVIFTISVTNDGPSVATGVTVTDNLPSGYSFVSSDGDYVGGLWTIGTIGIGETVTLNITATVLASGDYFNVAEVTTANEDDTDSTPNNDDGDQSEDDEDNADTDPNPVIDLSLVKTVSDATPNVGDDVIFTISVTNDGPSVATGVTVTDNLPSGYSFVSSDGDYVGGLWTIGTIGIGETVTLNITATVLASGDYFNVAEVTTANEDDVDSTPNNDDGDQSEDDEDNAETNPNPVIDLSLVKTVSDATPNVGDDVIFTISVTNDGPSIATGVTVTDNLPSGYSFVSSDGDYVGGLWTIGTIGIGETVTLNITAIVLASGDYFNVAEVTTANEDDVDSTPNNDDGDQSEDDEDNAETNPNPVIDLSLVKTVSDATPNVGDDVIFTISVTNDGPSVATGVTVTDNLPSGYSFVSSDGDYVGGLWTIGTIGIGETVTLNITATVLASGDYFNVAEVTTANEDDTDSTPNNDDGDQSEDDEDNADTDPNPVIDLSLVKTVSDATPNVGDNVTFTISVTNDGPSVATGVTVTDNLPSGYSFVSSDGDYVGGLWTIGTIGIGETVTLNITATVLASGDYFNVAEVTTANEDDSDSTPNNDDGDQSEDDEDNAETNPNPVIDLSLVKTVSDATPNVGDDVIFTISVTNDGPSVATGVTVTDNLPSGYSFVSSDGDYVGGLWTIGTIGIGETVTLNITATVLASGDYFNVAEVTSANEDDVDSTPNNDDGDQSEDDEDNADTDPNPVIDLSLVKTVSDATPNVGDDVIFTISVTNDGPSVATGVTVTDNLPSGYSFVSSDGDYVGGLWTIGTIGVGETVTLNITATVLASGDYFNVAEVTTANEDDIDSTPNNDDGDQSEDDEDNAETNPNPVIDLSLVKTVSDATPNVGDDVIFTISVTNDGPSVATGVTVTDNLPSGYSFVSSDGDYVGGLWTIGTIGIGETVTLNITATVLASGDYFNVAEVTTANEDDVDSTPNNDDGDQSEDDEDNADTDPNPIIDLSLTKVVDNATPNVGDDVIFTISVTNDGPSVATGVTVTDNLPSGYSFVSSDGDYVGGLWTIGTIGIGETVTLNITATVLASGDYFNVAEVTTANEDDVDSTPNNDDGDQSEDDEDNAETNPNPVIDLSLTKVVDNATPNVGDDVIFTISVTNDGPSVATGVTVTDNLPSGYSFVSSDGDYVGSLWTIGTIGVGETVTLNITATVLASGDYFNVAEVTTANEDDTDSTPNNDDGDQSEDDEDNADTNPNPVIDLSLTKVVNDATPNVGDDVIFTISVTNDGPSVATGVTVTDNLPSGYSFVSSDGDYVGGLWTIGTIGIGETVTLNITATVLASGDYFNVAEVTTANEDDVDSTPNNDDGDQSEDDEDNAETNPNPVIDLSLVKTVSDATPNVGDDVIFTISVTNDGPSVATGVTVTDNLPSGYSFVSSDGDYVGGLWTIGTIGIGETVTLNITATVLASGDYFNVAEVTTANEDDVDSTPNNDDGDQSEDDEDNAETNPNPVIDLSLVKTVSDATPNVGDDVIFTISVTNDGPSVATGVTVTDNLPSGYSFVSSDGDYVGGLWAIGTIGIGETVTLNITATVLASGDYFNVAEVTTANEDDVDSTPNNDDGDQSEDDEDNAETNPNPVIDLSLVKTVSDATPNVGDDVIFTISVTNDGPSVATGVTVTDNLPSGYSFVSSDGDYVGGLWTIGTIDIGETVTLNITATVLASGDYFNVAEVTTANEDDTDSTPNNDDGDQSEDDEDNAGTDPNPVIDLSLVKTVSDATPNVGDDVIFTISVTNDGPSVATGVTVTDNLPSGYSFVSSDGDYVGGLWTIGTIGIGETVTLNITATVLASGDYFNVA